VVPLPEGGGGEIGNWWLGDLVALSWEPEGLRTPEPEPEVEAAVVAVDMSLVGRIRKEFSGVCV